MAIQFARCQYVSRSTGGNACRKASYNQRETLRCERTGEVFSFKERRDNAYHEILLPAGADPRFQNSSVLWNEAERCEKRKDSQVAKEFVIALPDDKSITFEDRVSLSQMFGTIFVEKGVAAQLDIHQPHDGEKNWHTHFLVTTRRFSEDGQSLASMKATDLDPVFRKGVVVEADLWGEVWRDMQNAYFAEKGYELTVDPIGMIPQEHLGPVRMRHHMNEAILRSQTLQKANEQLSQDPKNVVETLTQTRAVFTHQDVESFLKKHVPLPEREGLLEKVFAQENVLALYDQESGQQTAYFTTQEVRAEEEKLIRFADSIAQTPRVSLDHPLASSLSDTEEGGLALSAEQKAAYTHCVNSAQNLCIVQGRAGTGKSTLLNPIRVAHEEKGFRVLGLAPTHKVALHLKADGFQESKTCHSFLFSFKNNREILDAKTLVVVDEAGMLGTEICVELFHAVKMCGAKLLLVGDDRQLGALSRGNVFSDLAERYGAVELKEVRRQTLDWQKAVSENLSQGDVKEAVNLLEAHKAVQWQANKEAALSALLKDWGKESLAHPQGTRLILAQQNVDVDALNQGARDILRAQGRLGGVEITCMTQRGEACFAEGDRVQFTKTDSAQGLVNAHFGVIQAIDAQTKKLTILLDHGEEKRVDPHIYEGLRHGYASTVYKGQGSTLDHVYVLHSGVARKQVNYVALTRQTKSLSLYVSKDETPSRLSLVRQMSREAANKTSLSFETHQAIERRQEKQVPTTSLKRGVEKVFIKVKDFFHSNADFYKVDQPKESPQQLVSLTSPAQERKSPVISDEVKKAMLGEELYNRVYHPELKQETSQAITDEVKKAMLGEELYNRVYHPELKQETSHAITDEVKKAMLGERIYIRGPGKP